MPSFAATETLDFTYNQDLGPTDYYGFNRLMGYDVAIRISDPLLIGAQVTGLSVAFPVDETDVEDLSGWIATELRAIDNKNVADITEQSATLADGNLTVTFSEPCTIPSNGLYVGYSFTITAGAPGASEPGPGYPIFIAPGTDADGFYLRTTYGTRQEWSSISESISYVSGMVVNISAEISDNDALIVLTDKVYAVAAQPAILPVQIVNRGANQVTEIEYSYSAGEFKGSDTFVLPESLPGLGDATTVELNIGPFPEVGGYELEVSVDKVNGVTVTRDNNKAYTDLDVLAFMPVKRPLVEEYTGLRCGYCPRGYVAMEEMNESLADMFVGMAYHTATYESEMVTMSNSQFPMTITGFPNGDIDRQTLMDPGEFQEAWPAYSENVAPADIDVVINWANNDKNEFAITATTKFAKDIENGANYRLAIALVADNVYNPRWAQFNNYAGNKNMPDTDLWNIFTKGSSIVTGLTFNDVVAYFKDVKGIYGSIPSAVSHNEELNFSYSIKKEDVKNLSNENFLNPEALVHAVAMLIDVKSGHVLNCNKSNSLEFGEQSGVEEINSDVETVSIRYYDMQGRQIATPSAGLLIKEEKLSNGASRYSKIMLNN